MYKTSSIYLQTNCYSWYSENANTWWHFVSQT